MKIVYSLVISNLPEEIAFLILSPPCWSGWASSSWTPWRKSTKNTKTLKKPEFKPGHLNCRRLHGWFLSRPYLKSNCHTTRRFPLFPRSKCFHFHPFNILIISQISNKKMHLVEHFEGSLELLLWEQILPIDAGNDELCQMYPKWQNTIIHLNPKELPV